ncbi:MAG: hypothetical protein ACREJB_09410, partial [Planctomycetaceae bacterium]
MDEHDRHDVAALPDLVPLVHRAEGFASVVASLERNAPARIDGTWGSACALSAAALAPHSPRLLLVVLPRPGEVDDFAADVAGFLGSAVEVFPAWERLPEEYDVADAVFGRRLRVLQTLERLAAAERGALQSRAVSART